MVGSRIKTLLGIAVIVVPLAVEAQEPVKVPDEVTPFVEAKREAVALESGDLNGDGRKDLVLVVSDVVAESDRYDEGAGSRSVMILIRQADNSLKLAARNNLVAMCQACGGAFGDPFEGVDINGTKFTVLNYGGSADRWAYHYTFAYSRRDDTWQAVRVEEINFHTLDPDKTMKKRVYTPPKDFGLITFADFDPDSFRKQGKG
jgi:hypothetical protein